MNTADQFQVAMHTPGPWEAVNNLVRSSMVQPEGSGRVGGVMVAECADGFGLKFGSEACANAKLIAAAPELLAVLQELVNEVQPLGIDRPAYQAALEVINKAQGEKS